MAADPRSLNGLLYGLGAYFRDARRGTTVADGGASVQSFRDTTLITTGDDRWRGSEVWFEDSANILNATLQGFLVTASVGTTGALTLDRPFTDNNAHATGHPYVLQNLAGEGWPHHLKLEALLTVLRDEGLPVRAAVDIATPDTADYWNAIPTGLDSVYRVEAVLPDGTVRGLPPAVWRGINKSDRLIYLPYTAPASYRLYGRTMYAEPAHAALADFATALPGVQPYRVIRKAAEWLLSSDGAIQSQRVVQGLYGDRQRGRRTTPLPNEIFLGDWQ